MSKSLTNGASAPGFTLETPHGVAISAHELLMKGPLVLEFVRGLWDPNSRDRLETLARRRERLETLDARCLVVTCETSEAAASELEARPSPLSIVVDTTRTVARAYGVYRLFSYGAWRAARPATFVVDRCGFLRTVHRGRSPIDALALDDIERSLEALQSRPARRPRESGESPESS